MLFVVKWFWELFRRTRSEGIAQNKNRPSTSEAGATRSGHRNEEVRTVERTTKRNSETQPFDVHERGTQDRADRVFDTPEALRDRGTV